MVLVPTVLWHSWLGVRKSTWPVKMSDEVLVWLSVCSDVQIVCIWSSWCHCIPKPHHPLPSLVLPFWYRLTQVVQEKRLLNRCSTSSTMVHSIFSEQLSDPTVFSPHPYSQGFFGIYIYIYTLFPPKRPTLSFAVTLTCLHQNGQNFADKKKKLRATKRT